MINRCLPIFVACLLGIGNLNAIVREDNVRYLETPFGTEIEVYLQKPDINYFPLIVFLHGTSYENGIRGFTRKFFDFWIKKGYGVMAVSLPGFGFSGGEKDFCGPLTINSLQFALDTVLEELDIFDFGLVGFGQGALASLLLASKRNDIRCVVAANAVYDLENFKEGKLFERLKEKNYAFDPNNKKAFEARSLINHFEFIEAPVFMLHREGGDGFTSDIDAKSFYDAMIHAEKDCCLRNIPKKPQGSLSFTYREVVEFTEEWIDNIMD